MFNNKATSIKYSLVRSSRKTIGIIIHPDGSVVVCAPNRATNAQIEDVVKKRTDWILKHQRSFKGMGPIYSKREFVDGEKHLLLGSEYILRIKISQHNRVIQNGQFIDIECKDFEFVQPLMKQWYIRKANEIIPGIIKPIVDQFRTIYSKAPVKITLKNMKSRWGSCSSKGNISINIKLVKSPQRSIEYVMAHELCHLIQMNHSKNYYSLLAEFMPDWRERKKQLEHFMR